MKQIQFRIYLGVLTRSEPFYRNKAGFDFQNFGAVTFLLENWKTSCCVSPRKKDKNLETIFQMQHLFGTLCALELNCKIEVDVKASALLLIYKMGLREIWNAFDHQHNFDG